MTLAVVKMFMIVGISLIAVVVWQIVRNERKRRQEDRLHKKAKARTR
jgi:hypothetical protein